MTSRSQVFIADLLHSLDALGIESIDTAREVMRMLSLEAWHEIVSSRTPVVEAADHDVVPSVSATFPTLAVTPASRSTSPERLTDSTLGQVRSVVASPDVPCPAWVDHIKFLSAPFVRRARPRVAARSPSERPRCGLSACLVYGAQPVCATLISSGRVKDELDPLKNFETPAGAYRISSKHLTATMDGDVERVMGRLGALLSRDRLDRLLFEGSPMRGCRTPRRRGIRPWKPPALGSAVLVLTDPDCVGRSALCQGCCQVARVRGCGADGWRPTAIAAPYPANRWPAALASRLHPVPWDRRTTVAMVRRTVSAAAHHRIA
jgi:hypothetical protein